MASSSELRSGRTLDFRQNSLNTIRLLAALSVMYFHGTAHMQTGSIPLLENVLDYFMGIPLFFSLSGFLLWQSVGKERSFLTYVKKRFRRIYPELWLGVAVELIVLLVLFAEPIRWGMLGLFALCQSTVFQFWTPDFLRSYGCGTPNGSLWSICTLIQFYVLLYPAGKVLRGRKLWVWLLVLGVSILLGVSGPLAEQFLPGILYKLYCQTVFPYLWLFVAGMLISEKWEALLPLLRQWWMVFAALSFGAVMLKRDIPCGYYGLIRSYSLILAVLGFAYRFPQYNVKKDISYGIYIYHMTVINAMIMLDFRGEPLWLLLAMVLSCALAYVSSTLCGLWQPGAVRKK